MHSDSQSPLIESHNVSKLNYIFIIIVNFNTNGEMILFSFSRNILRFIEENIHMTKMELRLRRIAGRGTLLSSKT